MRKLEHSASLSVPLKVALPPEGRPPPAALPQASPGSRSRGGDGGPASGRGPWGRGGACVARRSAASWERGRAPALLLSQRYHHGVDASFTFKIAMSKNFSNLRPGVKGREKLLVARPGRHVIEQFEYPYVTRHTDTETHTLLHTRHRSNHHHQQQQQ